MVHDRDLGFRHLPEESLKKAFPGTSDSYFVLSLGYPLTQCVNDKHNIWKYLKANGHLPHRTVTIVNAMSFRREGIDIREAASIEQTAQNFLLYHQTSKLLKELCQCAHLVVRFDDGGALHYDHSTSGGPTYHYCPFFFTDEESYPIQFGRMTGYRTIMVASITKGIAYALGRRCDVPTGINEGIRLGVLLGRMHFRNGYAGRDALDIREGEPLDWGNRNVLESALSQLFKDYGSSDSPKVRQLKAAADKSKKSSKDFATSREYPVASLKLPRTEDSLRTWSRVSSFRECYKTQSDFDVAVRGIVKEGLDTVVLQFEPLTHVSAGEVVTPHGQVTREESFGGNTAWFPRTKVLCPYGEFGEIKTSDRQEIDNLIGITAIIRKYLEDRDWKKPLSIATFGPPGSGKSFTIKQILKSVNSAIGTSTLEYNVAQFTSVNNLTTAFHQAQDKALSEEVPLIIFDEFDANFEGKKLGWLKYFLAPMQDGKFKGEHGTYQVGRAILVFAGGTSRTFDDFCNEVDDKEGFKNVKGPDFVSRLRGYLNIGDINVLDEEETVSDLLMYRRAIILRSILESKAAKALDLETKRIWINDKVVQAFLKVKQYKHGVRSMEAIVEMASNVEGGFVVASLPPPSQLEMHVRAEEFLSLLK